MRFNQFHRIISWPPQKKKKKNYNGTYNLYYIFNLMSRIDLASKNLLANSLRNFSKKIKIKETDITNVANSAKNAKVKRTFLLLPVHEHTE